MAKASKIAATATPSLADDTATIVAAFRTFGVVTVDDTATKAMLRRVSDKETFNAIRVKSLAAWLETNRGYAPALAIKNVDKSLTAPNFGKPETQRTAIQQSDYKNANDAWGYMLRVAKIESMNKRKPRAPKTAGEKAIVAAVKARETAAAAIPVTPQSVVVTRGDVVLQLGLASALMGRVFKENAKSPELKGDRGSLIRDLVQHVAKQMAIIEAMAN